MQRKDREDKQKKLSLVEERCNVQKNKEEKCEEGKKLVTAKGKEKEVRFAVDYVEELRREIQIFKEKIKKEWEIMKKEIRNDRKRCMENIN